VDAVSTAEPRAVDRDARAERVRPVAPLSSGPQAGPDSGLAADEAGLRAAFLAHGRELLGLARRSLASPQAAEDAVQETFTRAWRSRHRFDPSLGSLRTWLFAIERRVLVAVMTRQAKESTAELDEAGGPRVEDRVDAALLGWQVASVLTELDDDHRLVITELYFNGRTSKEVSALFGIPEGTVRSRAFYALRTLRGHLESLGWTP